MPKTPPPTEPLLPSIDVARAMLGGRGKSTVLNAALIAVAGPAAGAEGSGMINPFGPHLTILALIKARMGVRVQNEWEAQRRIMAREKLLEGKILRFTRLLEKAQADLRKLRKADGRPVRRAFASGDPSLPSQERPKFRDENGAEESSAIIGICSAIGANRP